MVEHLIHFTSIEAKYKNEVSVRKINKYKRAKKGKEILQEVEREFETLPKEVLQQFEEADFSRALQISMIDTHKAPRVTSQPMEVTPKNVEALLASQDENIVVELTIVIETKVIKEVVATLNKEVSSDQEKEPKVDQVATPTIEALVEENEDVEGDEEEEELVNYD